MAEEETKTTGTEALTEGEQPGAAGGDTTGEAQTDQPAAEATKTFTQAELDKIVSDRVARDRKAREAEAKKAAEDAQKSETERERDAREAAEKRAADLEAQIAERDDRDAFVGEWVALGMRLDRAAKAYVPPADGEESDPKARAQKAAAEFPEWKQSDPKPAPGSNRAASGRNGASATPGLSPRVRALGYHE